jgi:hypothetical protein
MIKELTLSEAAKNSANFMYIWADENKFLQFIDPKYADIIRTKKANQTKLLTLSVQKYGGTMQQYTNAVRAQFIEDYGITPAEALVRLANGETVAGKNWEVGMFGIGALHTSTFDTITVNDEKVTVDPNNGHIFVGSRDITDTSKTVYATIDKKTIAYQLFGVHDKDFDLTFMSQYNKTYKKYYAQSYVNENGQTINARTGKEVKTSDAADIWGNIMLTLQTFIDWLISLFGGNTSTQTLNASNTLPNQKEDGFVQKSGFGEAGTILLLAAGAGALLFGGMKGKKQVK